MKKATTGTSHNSNAAAATLQIDGDMTIYQAEDIKQRLLATMTHPATRLQVDLRNVSEMDTAGIQLLMAAKRAAAAHGKTLALTASSHAVTEVLDLFGLSSFFAEPAAA